jgi:hypothetical protein
MPASPGNLFVASSTVILCAVAHFSGKERRRPVMIAPGMMLFTWTPSSERVVGYSEDSPSQTVIRCSETSGLPVIRAERRYNLARGGACPNKALVPVDTANAGSAIGCAIADSQMARMPTAIRVGEQRFSLCGTSECQDYPIVLASRKSAPEWNHTLPAVSVEGRSERGRRRDVRIASIRFPPGWPPDTSRRMLLVIKKAGIGNRLGAVSIASSLRTAVSRIISYGPRP